MNHAGLGSPEALITGGSGGIGRALAVSLAATGARVHLVGQSERTSAVAQVIHEGGGRAQAYRGSVADEAFCRSVVEGIERDTGRLDYLINAAATLGTPGPFVRANMADFTNTLRVDLLGTAHCMRWALPGMVQRGFGRVVNFAGGGAAYAYPNFSAYGIAKCAVVRLTETVAAEITTPNVTINVIAPGAVDTPMLAQVRQAGGEVRTVTDVSEAVRLVKFLVSSEAARIHGRFIHVRDPYTDQALYDNDSMLKLRRVERR